MPATQTAISIDAMFARAAEQLAQGTLSVEDLNQLHAACRKAIGATPTAPLRQRLLYIQSTSPFIGAGLISAVVHEPVVGGCGQLEPTAEELPYQCVHDALCDGWQIIHFPDQRVLGLEPKSPDVGVLGFEFILQKIEPVAAEDES